MKYLDKVRVLKNNENTGTWQEIYNGHVIGTTPFFVKVFKPRKRDDWQTGDVQPTTAEWFAIDSKRIKTVLC